MAHDADQIVLDEIWSVRFSNAVTEPALLEWIFLPPTRKLKWVRLLAE